MAVRYYYASFMGPTRQNVGNQPFAFEGEFDIAAAHSYLFKEFGEIAIIISWHAITEYQYTRFSDYCSYFKGRVEEIKPPLSIVPPPEPREPA